MSEYPGYFARLHLQQKAKRESMVNEHPPLNNLLTKLKQEPVADGGGLPPLESAEDAWKRGYEEGVQKAIFNETGCRLESVDDVPPYTQPVSPEGSSR